MNTKVAPSPECLKTEHKEQDEVIAFDRDNSVLFSGRFVDRNRWLRHIPKSTHQFLFKRAEALTEPTSETEEVIHHIDKYYKLRQERRYHYLNLFSFLAFLLLYLVVIILQRNSKIQFQIKDAITRDLLPADPNGDPEVMYGDANDVYTWLDQKVVQKYWSDPKCGDGVCDPGFETSAFGRFGCLSDCGFKNTTAVRIAAFQYRRTPSVTSSASLNLCHKTETLSKALYFVPVCYWETDIQLKEEEVEEWEADVPDGEWEVRVKFTGTGVQVFGGVSVLYSGDTTSNSSGTNSKRRILSMFGDPVPTQEELVKRHLLQDRTLTPTSTSTTSVPTRVSESLSSSPTLSVGDIDSDTSSDSIFYSPTPDSDSRNQASTEYEDEELESPIIPPSDWLAWEQRIAAEQETSSSVTIASTVACYDYFNATFHALPMSCASALSIDCCDRFLDVLSNNCYCTSAALLDYSNMNAMDFFSNLESCPAHLNSQVEGREVRDPILVGTSCPFTSPILDFPNPHPIACELEVENWRESGLGEICATVFDYDTCCPQLEVFQTYECPCSSSMKRSMSKVETDYMKTIYKNCSFDVSQFDNCAEDTNIRLYVRPEHMKLIKMHGWKKSYADIEPTSHFKRFSSLSSEDETVIPQYCQADPNPPLDCQLHFDQYLSDVYLTLSTDCPATLQAMLCDTVSANTCYGQIVLADGSEMRYDQILRELSNPRCTESDYWYDYGYLPDCDSIDEMANEVSSVVQTRVLECALTTDTCFKDYDEEATTSIVNGYFHLVGPHVMYYNYLDLISQDGQLDLTCEELIARQRSLDSYFNKLCVASFNKWDSLHKSCDVHADCEEDMFCALSQSFDDHPASCKLCNHCCSAPYGVAGVHPDQSPYPYIRELFPSEPGCGHCHCAECSPGCTIEKLYFNTVCDEECFTQECNWDGGSCFSEMNDRILNCPADTAFVVAENEDAFCCPVPNSLELSLDINVHAHTPVGTLTPLGLNYSQISEEVVTQRFLSDSNRIVAGMLLHVERFEGLRSCPATDQFTNLYGSCRANRDTESYGVDPIFQSGNSLYDDAAFQNMEYYYPEVDDVNKFGSPFGFESLPLAGMGPGYPVLFDVNLDEARSKNWSLYLKEGQYLNNVEWLTVQFVTYNGNYAMFANVKVFFRFAKTGGVWVTNRIEVMNAEMYVTTFQVFRGVLEIIFVLAWMVNVVGEVHEMRSRGFSNYFQLKANTLDLVSLGIGGVVICCWVTLLVTLHYTTLKPRYNVYEDIYQEAHWLQFRDNGAQFLELANDFLTLEASFDLYSVYLLLNMVNIVLMLSRLLRLMDFHPDIGLITRTIRKAGSDLINFTALSFCIIFVYALMAHCLIGPHIKSFFTVSASMQTCMLFMVGDFGVLGDPDILAKLDLTTRISLVILFWSYMILVFMILLNALLGIIVNAMDAIKSDQDNQDYHMASTNILNEVADMSCYLWRRWTRAFHGKTYIEEGAAANYVADLATRMDRRMTEKAGVEGKDWAKEVEEESVLQVGCRAIGRDRLEKVLSEVPEGSAQTSEQTAVKVTGGEAAAVAALVQRQLGENQNEVADQIDRLVRERLEQYGIRSRIETEQWRGEMSRRMDTLESLVTQIARKLDVPVQSAQDNAPSKRIHPNEDAMSPQSVNEE